MDANMLGRLHREDARDYKMAPHLTFAEWPVKNRAWRTGDVLNQGHTPHCVGFAGFQFLRSSPRTISAKVLAKRSITSDSLYYDCKVKDGEPLAEVGTDGRSLMKVFQDHGYLSSYVFANTALEIALWIANHGPVLFGIPWHERMFAPDEKGFLDTTGAVAGGHELIGTDLYPNAHSPEKSVIELVNSWGEDWGVKGRCYLTVEQMWTLIREGGDAIGALK